MRFVAKKNDKKQQKFRLNEKLPQGMEYSQKNAGKNRKTAGEKMQKKTCKKTFSKSEQAKHRKKKTVIVFSPAEYKT